MLIHLLTIACLVLAQAPSDCPANHRRVEGVCQPCPDGTSMSPLGQCVPLRELDPSTIKIDPRTPEQEQMLREMERAIRERKK